MPGSATPSICASSTVMQMESWMTRVAAWRRGAGRPSAGSAGPAGRGRARAAASFSPAAPWRRLRQGGADQRVAGDEGGELVLAPALGAGGAQRQHHPAVVGGAVHHADVDAVGQDGAPFGEHGARLAHGAGAVGEALVPVRRVAEHGARVAGAEGADDEVVARGRVLQHAERRRAGHGDAHRARPPPCRRRGGGRGSRGRARRGPPCGRRSRGWRASVLACCRRVPRR